MRLDDGAELRNGVADAVGGFDCVEHLAEFGDGVLRGDFGRGAGGCCGFDGVGLGLGAFGGVEEGVDVQATQGFDVVAVAFAALGFWGDFLIRGVWEVRFDESVDRERDKCKSGRLGLWEEDCVRAYIPFLMFAAAMHRSRYDFALATRGSGGRE